MLDAGASRDHSVPYFFDAISHYVIRSECLDRIVPLGEAHLRRSVNEFVQHYRFERNHQGLANELIESTLSPANTNGRVERRERLGGLLNFYSRAA